MGVRPMSLDGDFRLLLELNPPLTLVDKKHFFFTSNVMKKKEKKKQVRFT